jgi:TfoX/Sxy family transcriptional regulator of competence genes
VHGVDTHPGLAQPPDEETGELSIIFGDEYTHATSSLRAEHEPDVSAASHTPQPARHHSRMAYEEQLAERIRDFVSLEGGVTEKSMFGGLAFLVDGHMAVAASGQGGLMVRVDPEESAALVAGSAAEPMIMRGRPASGWLRVTSADVESDAELERWVRTGVSYARTLPPKG